MWSLYLLSHLLSWCAAELLRCRAAAFHRSVAADAAAAATAAAGAGVGVAQQVAVDGVC